MKNKKYDSMKAEQASKRKHHFSNGGTVAAWRGRSATFTDRKKQQAKYACRSSRGEQ